MCRKKEEFGKPEKPGAHAAQLHIVLSDPDARQGVAPILARSITCHAQPLESHPHASPTANKHHDVVLPAPVPARRKCRPRPFHAKCQCASRSRPALPSRPISRRGLRRESGSDPPIGLIGDGPGSAATLPAGSRANTHAQMITSRRRDGNRGLDHARTQAPSHPKTRLFESSLARQFFHFPP